MSSNHPTAEFIQLITSNQSRLYAYTLSLLGDRQHAMDVMQETNLILWRKAEQFRPGTNFSAWMLKVAYLQILTHRRNYQKHEVFVDNAFLERLAEHSAASIDSMDQQQTALYICLEKLPARQRDIVRRRYIEGASIKSVAAQLDIAASAIKQALFRARTSLIKCVQFRLKESVS